MARESNYSHLLTCGSIHFGTKQGQISKCPSGCGGVRGHVSKCPNVLPYVSLPESKGVGDFVGAEVEVGAEACCLSPACWLDLDLASEYGRTFGHMHVPFGKMTRHTRK